MTDKVQAEIARMGLKKASHMARADAHMHLMVAALLDGHGAVAEQERAFALSCFEQAVDTMAAAITKIRTYRG